MLFSISYQSKMKKLADEIRCPYNQLGLLFKFIKENPQKRYLIELPNSIKQEEIDKAIKELEIIKDIISDYTFSCHDLNSFKETRERGYQAFLDLPVTDWELFNDLIEQGASDIWIDGALGFQINALARAKGNTKIRAVPNYSSVIGNMQPNSFYIRPEDLDKYQEAIDVVFFREKEVSREEVCFTIYKRGSFIGNLEDLVPITREPTPNALFKEDFAQTRLNCRQSCKVPGHHCAYCRTYFNIGKNLQKILSN